MHLTIDVDPDEVAITKLRAGYTPRAGESAIEHVRLRGGSHQVPRRYDVFSTGASPEPNWRMAITVHDGVPLCRRLSFEVDRPDAEVRTIDLRGFSVDDIVELATKHVARPVTLDEHGNERVGFISLAEVRSGLTLPAVRSARKHAKRRITDDVLRKVAEVYRTHPDRNPTQAVQRHFALGAERTARDWVHRARAAGHLGPSIVGKSGERSS